MAIVRDIEPWDALLDAGRADERLVRQESQHPRFPELVALPTELHPDVAGALRARGVDCAVEPPGRGLRGGLRGDDDRHDRHRVGQVAVLPAARAGRALARRAGAGAVPVPVEGARAGPGALAARARASSARGRRSTTATRRASSAPTCAARQRDPHQPGHAAPRDPAQPRRLGRLLQEPRGGRDRRGARLPRRLRLARRQRAAAAAADLRAARHRAALPARVGDDRQPGRARLAADRVRRRHGDLARRLARAPGARSRCGTRRSPTRRRRRGARRWPRPPTCSPGS